MQLAVVSRNLFAVIIDEEVESSFTEASSG
jgi:hypothetical protein